MISRQMIQTGSEQRQQHQNKHPGFHSHFQGSDITTTFLEDIQVLFPILPGPLPLQLLHSRGSVTFCG